MTQDAGAAATAAFHAECGRVVSVLTGTACDWDLARGVRAGRVHPGAEVLAVRWRAPAARRLADHGGAEPGHRPAAPGSGRGRRAEGGGDAGNAERADHGGDRPGVPGRRAHDDQAGEIVTLEGQ
jgi:hypothetical protein